MGDMAAVLPDAGKGAPDRRGLAGFAVLVLGLSFFWSLFRRAGAAGLVALAGLDRGAALAVFYGLFAAFSVACCLFDRGHGELASRLAPRACLMFAVLATGLLIACGVCPAPPLGWAALAASAFATCALGLFGLTLCGRCSLFGENTALAAACSSALTSIVVTFAFNDVMLLGPGSAFAYLACGALTLCLAGSLLASEKESAGRASAGPGWSGGHMVVLCAAVVLSTALKLLVDEAFQDDLRLTKHLIGLVGLSLPLAALVMWPAVSSRTVIFYFSVGVFLLGTLLSAGSFPAAAVHVGSATMTTACALFQALLLAYAAGRTALGEGSAAWAAPLAFALPSALAGVLGYGLLGAADLSAGVQALLGVMAMLVLAGAGAAALCVLCARELGDAERGGQAAQALSAEVDDADVEGMLAVRYRLTARETAVAAGLYRGLTVKEIANAECLSVNTVQSHSKSIYRKMGIHSRRELVATAGDLLGQ